MVDNWYPDTVKNVVEGWVVKETLASLTYDVWKILEYFWSFIHSKGSTIQREEHVQVSTVLIFHPFLSFDAVLVQFLVVLCDKNAMLAWKRRIGMDLGQYMKGKLGWPGRIVPQQLPYLSERHYGDSELVRFKENGRFSTLSRRASYKANTSFSS
jgi:hypothetical protein